MVSRSAGVLPAILGRRGRDARAPLFASMAAMPGQAVKLRAYLISYLLRERARAFWNEQSGFGRSKRDAPRGGSDDLLDHPVAQLLAFPQRYDAVAGTGAVSDAERQ